ncbi:hypothetical protein [Flavobacterium aquidurense]|uniref:hypothetical protein n=1 Tax=Flavobacterium aquidurense TaxID=362413 RepID=UPI00371AAE37
MKKILIFIVLIVISCETKDSDDRIILTSGISMNPDEPRFGIEINSNGTLFYCEEIISNKGHYKYYQSKVDSSVFLNLKNEINHNFKVDAKNEPIVDATHYELHTYFGQKNKLFDFYFYDLNSKQIETIKKIIKTKNIKLEEITIHDFPKKLLHEKLPEPPPMPTK